MSAGNTVGASCSQALVASEALKISSFLFQAVERNFHPGRTWIRGHIGEPIGAGGMHSRMLPWQGSSLISLESCSNQEVPGEWEKETSPPALRR